MFHVFSDIILHRLIGCFEIKLLHSPVSLLVMEEPDVGPICSNLLHVDRVVLWHGQCLHEIARLHPVWKTSCSLCGFCGTGHMCPWEMWPLPFVIKQVLLFCPGKMEPLRPICKLVNKFMIFFLKKGRPWTNTRFQIRVAARPLFAFKKEKKIKERYIMFSRSGCWKALGN